MKKIIIVLTFLAIVIASGTSFAQINSGGGSSGGGHSQMLPIQDQATAREHLLKMSVRGSRYVHSESLDWGFEGTVTSTSATGTSAEDVLDKLFSTELVYRLTNPDDLVYGWVYLYDSQDNLLFYGNAKYLAKNLGEEQPQYSIWMQNIPLLENVSSAEVLALDTDGTTARRYQIAVNDQGQILFPPWYSGSSNGILAVRFQNGTVVTYNLANPWSETLETTTESAAKWKIDGHYVFQTGKVQIIETWNRPTALVRLSSRQTLNIDVMGLIQEGGEAGFERPTSMVVTSANGESTIQLNTDRPTEFENVPAGEYRLRFNWNKFGQPNTLYTGPEY